MILSPGTARMLERLLNRDLSAAAFEEWLASAVDDGTLLDEERQALSLLRLIVIESGEGLRPAVEVEEAAATLLVESVESDAARWTDSTNENAPQIDLPVQPDSDRFTLASSQA